MMILTEKTSSELIEPTGTPAAGRRLAGLERATHLLWWIVGFITSLIAFRFCLLMFGANQGNAFVDLILNLSQPFVAPFLSMFGSPAAGRSLLELPDIVAVVTYLLIGIGLDRLLRVLLAPSDPTGRAYRPTH